MKRIVVTDKIKCWAKAYADKVEKDLKPEDALKLLKSRLRGNESDYVKTVIDNLSQIMVMLPWDYADFYKNNFAKYDKETGENPVDLGRLCTIMGSKGKKKKQQLFQHIVDALQYSAVQQEVFPEYVKKLGIRSCVYCNAQYAVSAKKGKTDKSTFYHTNFTLDHWKPKSKYPYLAVAFYNLYPCCATCNQAKSWHERDWMMYCQDVSEANPFQFKLNDLSLTNYLTTWDAEKLKIEFEPKEKGKYPKYDENFHISKLYGNFRSEVEDVIWRSRIYSPKMIEAMNDSGVYKLMPHEVNRFIIGNYDREEDILKRPLAKLIQDVARQLGVI
jgi:hypothetical protein